MSPLNLTVVVAVCFLLVFAQSHALGLPRVMGVQVDLVPGFMVCVAMRCGVWALAGLALAGGFFLDALSTNPFGVSVLPLFLVAWCVQGFQDLVLRDTLVARLALGFAAGALAPILTVFLIVAGGTEARLGLGVVWPVAVLAIMNAITTPVWFEFFGFLDRAFNYGAIPESAFRPDREIKRGRS